MFSPDGSRFLSPYFQPSAENAAVFEAGIRLYETATWTLLETLTPRRDIEVTGFNAPWQALFLADPNTALVGNLDGSMTLWALQGRGGIGSVVAASGRDLGSAISTDGLTVAQHDGAGIGVFDADSGDLLWRSEDGGALMGAPKFSPDGLLRATSHGGELPRWASVETPLEVKLWEVATGALVATIPLPPRPKLSTVEGPFHVTVEFSLDGQLLAAAAGESVALWDVGAGELLGDLLYPHEGELQERGFPPLVIEAGLSFGEVGGVPYLVVATTAVIGVNVYDLGSPLKPALVAQTAPSGADDWDFGAAQTLPYRVGDFFQTTIVSAALSSQGVLALNQIGGQVVLHNLLTAERLATFLTGKVASNRLTFSAHGNLLAVGGVGRVDDEVILWDVNAAEEILSLSIGVGGYAWLNTDGTRMVSAEPLTVWNLDPESWEESLCQAAGRNLTRAEWDEFKPIGAPYRATCDQWPLEPELEPEPTAESEGSE